MALSLPSPPGPQHEHVDDTGDIPVTVANLTVDGALVNRVAWFGDELRVVGEGPPRVVGDGTARR